MLSGIIDASSKKLIYRSLSKEVVYNGEALVYEECVLEEGQLKKGHTALFTFTGEQIEVGESDNSFVVTIIDENGADVTSDYEVFSHFGKLKVLPRPLTLQSGSNIEEYSGNAVKNDEITLVSGELLADHKFEHIITGSREDVGISDNTFVTVIRDANDVDITKNYSIDYTFGKLEVVPMEVPITSKDMSYSYDGEEHDSANDYWTYADKEKRPAEGLEVTVLFSGSITDVGETEKKLISAIVKDNGKDVSFNYDFKYAGGKIIVTEREITITTLGDTKPYDGTPLTKSGLEIIEGSLLEGHVIADGYLITGSQTEIGRSKNTIEKDSIVILDELGKNVTSKYLITIEYGDLEVTAAEEKEEDPDVNTPPQDENADEETLNKVVAKVKAEHDGTLYLRRESFLDYTGSSNWTSAENVVYDQYLLYNGENYGMNYLAGVGIKNADIVYSKTLEIEVLYKNVGYILPYYQSIVQNNIYDVQQSDVYNAGNLSARYYSSYYPTDYTCMLSGQLGEFSDEEILYREFVKNTYLNMADSKVKVKCYQIAGSKNWLTSQKTTIEKINEVSQYVKSLAKYDINSQLESLSDNIVFSMLNNEENQYTALCRHYASTGVALFRSIGIPARYTTGYLVDVKAGEEVEVKVKNGHAWVEVYIDGIGWVYVECTASNESTTPDISDPTIPDVSNPTKTVTIEPTSTKLKYYNGMDVDPIDAFKVDKNFGALLTQGYTIQADVIISPNVTINGYGRYETTIGDVIIKDPSGKDVTSEFTITRKTGKVHLYIYEIIVKTGSAEKTFDGLPLRYEDVYDDLGYELGGDIFSMYYYEVTLTGNQTKVGKSSNTAKIVVREKGSGDDVTDMFAINTEYGSLKVNLRSITLQAGSLQAVYESGKKLTIEKDDYQLVLGDVVEGHQIYAEVEGTLSGPGYSYTYFKTVKVIDKNTGKEVTDQYEITLIGGTLFMSFS